MSSSIAISSGSFALAGYIFSAFAVVDKFSSKAFKNTVFNLITTPTNVPELKLVNYFDEVIGSIFPDKGFSFFSFFKNTIIILSLFLVLLAFFNTTNLLFSDDGLLINESGEITTSVSSEKINLKLQEISTDWVRYFNNYAFFDYVVLPLVFLLLSLFIPGYLSLILTIYILGLIKEKITPLTVTLVFIVDLLAKSALVVLYSALIFSLLSTLLGDSTFISTYSDMLVYYLDGITFAEENTVVPALFYSTLYINAWYILFIISILISKLLYITNTGKAVLKCFKIDESPICALGIVASLMTFVSCEMGLIVYE